MRIAINASFRMTTRGGGLIHLQQLLKGFAQIEADQDHSILIYARHESIPLLQPFIGPRTSLLSVGKKGMRPMAKLAWEQFSLVRQAKKDGADVIYCPGGIAPLKSSVPTVVSVRNALPFCDGLGPQMLGLKGWLGATSLREVIQRSVRSATRAIFPSRFLMNALIAKLRLMDAGHADLIYHGRDAHPPPGTTTSPPKLPERYILSVSHLYRYKHTLGLIEGYAHASDALGDQGLELVLAGEATDASYLRRIHERIRQYGLKGRVHLLGSVPHFSIPDLLAGCHFFVFQSLCENCPNTLVEALAAAAPIACSGVSAMPEIAGDAAIYFNPRDPKEIASVLVRLALDDDLRRTLRAKAPEQAAQFPTWEEVAGLTLASLERAVALR
jgi:glycosyltransferase involved in cell wall biosynthesis